MKTIAEKLQKAASDGKTILSITLASCPNYVDYEYIEVLPVINRLGQFCQNNHLRFDLDFDFYEDPDGIKQPFGNDEFHLDGSFYF